MPDRPETLATRPACPQPCDGCGLHYRTLLPAFLNCRGWVDLCAACVDPARGEPRAYTGRYPILTPMVRPTPPALRLIAGDANR